MEKESQSARQQDTNKLKEGLWEFFAHDDIEVPAVDGSLRSPRAGATTNLIAEGVG
jgi:hypothetical protein